MSWRATLPCTRGQAEALPDLPELLPMGGAAPVLVADEPDPARPDEWLLHAYFDHEPSADALAALARLGSGAAKVEQLGEDDWVGMSQAGLQPIRAGRFFVHTPTHRGSAPADSVAFEIDASLAFGTGQHATTSGCLEVLDQLQHNGCSFTNIADIGTGTGLLAFAALALWPEARCLATDIDSQAIAVARDNAAINGIKLDHGGGELLLAVADGMDSPMIAARAPFDLIVANILAGPLIELAPSFADCLAPRATIILAGLLEGQADAVIRAYENRGLSLARRRPGEWPVVILSRPRRPQAGSA
ncbi:MAG TPA: 50S ribosomal protein L11 methyltransferase [Sphingomicrobium sp.]|nr:50S ribosomal protein L11 methyltransferase [Sphingomicrobium sp.]